jgi:hypothetical protein
MAVLARAGKGWLGHWAANDVVAAGRGVRVCSPGVAPQAGAAWGDPTGCAGRQRRAGSGRHV